MSGKPRYRYYWKSGKWRPVMRICSYDHDLLMSGVAAGVSVGYYVLQ